MGRRKHVGVREGAHGVTLDLLGGAEGPAASTVALVLDGGSVHAGPVLERLDTGGKRLDGGVGAVLDRARLVVQVVGLELVRAKVGEFVDAVGLAQGHRVRHSMQKARD